MAETTLDGKVVMMTGAGRGMGREMSIGLASAGAKVAMIDIDEDVLNEAASLVENAGGQGAALPMVADVTSADNAATAVQKVLDRFGRIDVLVNDAVVGPERIGPNFFTDRTKFWDLDDGLWRQMLNVNIFGPQLMARTVVPHMLAQGWGRIVNITTSLDTMYLAGAGAYGPSKAALEAHSKIMAHDLEGTGVGVNVLIPGGPVNTRMIPEASGIPRENLIQPDVMVRPIIWLTSNNSDGVSGMRFIAALWDPKLDREARMEQAGAPLAWSQIESRSIYPDD
jgi:NAD(P)-dependent dehydrogenase (short-subunit alcohol dehydrogenase family)